MGSLVVQVQEPVKVVKAEQVFHLGDGKGIQVKVFFNFRIFVFQHPKLQVCGLEVGAVFAGANGKDGCHF